jgi:hypothetical protein
VNQLNYGESVKVRIGDDLPDSYRDSHKAVSSAIPQFLWNQLVARLWYKNKKALEKDSRALI